jgi:hypothetical protein
VTSTGDQLVEEYLRRFDNASVFLTDERRAELRQEIVEHIAAGVEEAEAAHADAVRAVLDRLGPPADIVASETGSDSSGATPRRRYAVPLSGAAGRPRKASGRGRAGAGGRRPRARSTAAAPEVAAARRRGGGDGRRARGPRDRVLQRRRRFAPGVRGTVDHSDPQRYAGRPTG